MKLVVGLGNPGPRYADTRHNVGFRVVECFASRCGAAFEERFAGRYGLGSVDSSPVGVLQPHTFMNRSGDSVAAALRELGIDEPERDLCIVYDDMDLPLGKIRLRHGGGAGGHNGIAHVIAALGTTSLPRLRFGVGRPPPGDDPIDYVLSAFTPAEERELVGVIDTASEALAAFASDGMEVAMNRFNLQPNAGTEESDA